MSDWTIAGFKGINNMQDPFAIGQLDPKVSYGKVVGGSGSVHLVKCINYDIDDSGGLVKRDANPYIFTATFDAKLTQKMASITFSADGNLLRYTKPFSLEFEPRRSSIRYSEAIVLIQEVEDGIWVSTTNKIYFHRGKNPTVQGGFVQVAEYNFPAIMGTGEKVHASKLGKNGNGFLAVFATTKGICIGDSSGGLENISEGVFSYSPGQRGISYLREGNGMVQYQVKMLNDDTASYNEQQLPNLIIDSA